MSKKTYYGSVFWELTRRHLAVFFRNRVRLLYTLLVPVIIFLVYLLFLRTLELDMVKNTLAEFGVSLAGENAVLSGQIAALIDSWMLSGIISISTITVALQTTTVIVEDKQNGVNRDFVSSPVPKPLLIASYFLYNFVVTSLICLIFFAICLIYLAAAGEFLLSFAGVLLSLAVIAFSTLVSTLFTVFLCSFIKSEGTMMSIVAIFSTAIGFLIGAYMPLGMLPQKMQWVQGLCGFLPNTYACSLLRYAFMEAPLSQVTATCAELHIDPAALAALSKDFGYTLNFFGAPVDPAWQAVALAVFTAAFAALNVGVGGKLAEVLGIGKKKRGHK